VLTLDITPNRPDLLSHLGVAREVAAACGQRLKASLLRPTEKGPEVTTLARVLVEEPAAARRYLARVVQNVKLGPSPAWLRKRLQAIGQRPINNVVDVTNYVLHELGHPLHAFDLSKLGVENGLPTIRVRAARAGETLTTLDGVERKLHPDDLLIADAKIPVALAGVMGGAATEVSGDTTAVLLESAYFDPRRIRRTARRHGLKTEASYRFERGADPGMAGRAVDRCAQLLIEVAEGDVAKGTLDVSQKGEPGREIPLRIHRVAGLLGVELAPEEIVQLLDPIEIRCTSRNESTLRFQPPSFRPDLTLEVDLIEELARRHGYDAVPALLPDASGEYVYVPPSSDLRRDVREALLASGVSEAVTWAFGSPKDHSGEGSPVRLINPLGEEFSALRTSLLPGLLQVLAHNQRHGAQQVRIFEMGTTFHAREGGGPSPSKAAAAAARDRALPREEERVALVLWGGRHFGRWYEGGAEVDFSDLAGVLESVWSRLDLDAPLTLTPQTVPNGQPYCSAVVSAGQTRTGWAARVTPEAVAAHNVIGPVFAAELSVEALAAVPRRRVRYSGLPRFPGTRRDVAVVAKSSLSSEAIRGFIEEHAGGPLGRDVVERVRLFDVYRGKPIPRAHTSLAFAIEYRSSERTLTDAEVSAAFEGVLVKLEHEFGVQVRR
ncbi:MAG: phenylalanine--tRNA ligase subunit beta, partial [Deltaproteobacteria bacterium]|nr:phenylalanine--tRNA ligase subunit beta [Deltaproteobacteria bacterium]